jgi:hypothetical protein
MRTSSEVNLTVKFSALILTIAMGLEGTGAAQEIISAPEEFAAQALDAKAAKAKAEVTRRGVGEKSKIRVKLRDKHELKGRITRIDEDSFQIQIEPDWLDEPSLKGSLITLPYMEVEKVRGARSRGANIGIGIGMVAAAVAILVAVALLKYDRCKRGFCDP